METRKIRFVCVTKYGRRASFNYDFPAGTTDQEIYELGNECAREYAASYESDIKKYFDFDHAGMTFHSYDEKMDALHDSIEDYYNKACCSWIEETVKEGTDEECEFCMF